MHDEPTVWDSWMSLAIELASSAAVRDEVPVGAILIHEGQIVGQGSNRREEKNRVASHAEIEALENFAKNNGSWRVKPGTTLVTTTEPCLMCTGSLLWARVDNIVFGCFDPKSAGLTEILPLIEAGRFDHKLKSVLGGVLQSQASSMMTQFFKNKRKRNPDGTVKYSGHPPSLS